MTKYYRKLTVEDISNDAEQCVAIYIKDKSEMDKAKFFHCVENCDTLSEDERKWLSELNWFLTHDIFVATARRYNYLKDIYKAMQKGEVFYVEYEYRG